MTSRTGQITLGTALVASLALHLSAFGLAHTIRDWRPALVTESHATEPQPSPADEPPPEEDEIKPGIERGAPALVAWIGYEEYQEHLARLGETDQAAFTSAIARGEPDSTSAEQDPPRQTPPEEAKAQASPPPPEVVPTPQGPVVATKIDDPKVSEAAAPPPEVAEAQGASDAKTQALEPARKVESVALPVQPAEQRAPAPVESKVEEATPAEATPELQVAQVPVKGPDEDEPARIEPERQPEQEQVDEPSPPSPEVEPSPPATSVPTPMAGLALTPVSTPQGERVEKDAAASEKDSSATSVEEIPESKWDSGKPLAVKGMELRPYSLQRHILWDSHDVMFSQQLNHGRWEGRVQHNPIVSMRFDRHGRVGEVRIIRPSGYAPLDQLYLQSWMARWTAADKRLEQLSADELTSPIQMKIVFIDEPKVKAAKPGQDKNADHGS